jgi:hypothetical protein
MKKLMHCYETPLSDGLGPPIIINSRLGFPAKQLWLTIGEWLSWIHDVCDPGKKFSFRGLVIHFFCNLTHKNLKLGLQIGR